jgi:imidazolonepropionase-like amidohydrolase
MMSLFTLVLLAAAPAQEAGATLLLRAAKVYTADAAGMIDNGAVLIRGGKVLAVGRAAEVAPPAGARVEDLGMVWLVPGLIEPHCHVAGSLSDLNDGVFLANPELETTQVVEPQNPYMQDATAAGITCALLIPGSGNNMAGFGTIVKTAGDTVEEVIVRAPGSLKVAQAGNPERYSWGVGRALMNWNTRDALSKGLAWAEAYRAGKAEWDPVYANFLGLADGSVPTSVHTQIYQVVLATITMQARDLGLKTFVDHGTFDAWHLGPLAVEYEVPLMVGPRNVYFDRANSQFQGVAWGWLHSSGGAAKVGYNTDSPVLPEEELPYQAALGVRLGAGTNEDALRGMTAHAAEALRIADIAGRLAPGLDADLAAWTGDPLDPRSRVLKTWIRGEVVYDAAVERRY